MGTPRWVVADFSTARGADGRGALRRRRFAPNLRESDVDKEPLVTLDPSIHVAADSLVRRATPAAAPAGSIARTSPIDLRSLEPVPSSTPEEIGRAVARARAAQELFRTRAFEERVDMLRRAAKAMLERRHEVMTLAREEMGKLEIEALFNEALGPLDVLNGWVSVVKKAAAREQVSLNPIAFPGKRAYIDLVPRGVVGIIAPWNFPVSGLYRALYPALLLGNAIVLKPSEYTPRTSEWFVRMLQESLPAGVAQVVLGDGTVGAALIESGIDACVFTGSPRAGRAVRIACAERGIPSSIEMGGKDCAIVLADCDLVRTTAGITHWALSNVGQSCGAIEVALVEDSIANEVVERLRGAWSRLRVGPAPYAEIAPLANRRQLEIVEAHVKDALDKGAKLVCGGRRTGEGLFYEPTVLDRCTDEMQVVTDETFGPVLAVVRVEGASEAIRRVNRSRYGLGASIWTKDYARAERLADRLDVGVVDVNNHSFTGAIAALPWSGTRETGFGVANSHHALSTFARPKAVVIDRGADPEPFWMPFDGALFEMGNALCEAQQMRPESLLRAWKLPLLIRKRVQTVREFFAFRK
mgnify:CR=1 FL=1